MGTVATLVEFLRASFTAALTMRVADLQFWHYDTARLLGMGLFAVALAALVVRSVFARRPGRDVIALPALLAWIRRSWFSFVRHAALLLFLGGLPFFFVALADPYTSLTREEVRYPGRRIALMIDASSSMIAPFKAEHLNAKAPSESAFFTSIAAAEYFVRLRMGGRYRDLMALVEFGDEAYVITPFTHDYNSILLSISLIGNATEWGNFPDRGTVIAHAVDQSVGLFRAFNFREAVGNIMVIFTDGLDSEVTINGRNTSEILEPAIATKTPIYFIRVANTGRLGQNNPDPLWRTAVEKTGGAFYAASDERVILKAISDIDNASVGEISTARYSTQRAQFSPFATTAVGLWSIAALLKLTVPYLRKFP